MVLAQSDDIREQQEVKDQFELFFKSLHQKDTVVLKSVIFHPHDTRWFFQTFTGDEEKILGSSGSTVRGLLNTVSSENRLIGVCHNKFENYRIQVSNRYATVTADYMCYVGNRELNHKGVYNITFLKEFSWKIENVDRYIHKIQ